MSPEVLARSIISLLSLILISLGDNMLNTRKSILAFVWNKAIEELEKELDRELKKDLERKL